MSDDKSKTGAPDRDRINVNEDYEVRGWSKKFGVTPQQLKKAVQSVRTSADAVRKYLGKYQELYSTDRLRRWAKQVEEWAKYLASIYIYFDNDQAGYAARNALEVKRLINGTRSRIEKTYAA
jgi:uncharacterized protein YecE (DUF72 family)